MEKEEILKITKQKTIDTLNSVDQKIINISLMLDKLPGKINETFEIIRIIADQQYPRLDKFLTIEQYCKFYILDEINQETLEKADIPKQGIEHILKIKQQEIGITLSKELFKKTKKYCESLLGLIETKKKLEEYVDRLLRENYINTYKTVTPKIAFKMLEISGSFKRLAKFPASTIQLLGSEKSFFKALKYNKKTPKYGVIYNHPKVIEAKLENKGKVARTLANIMSLAIKADIYKKDISEHLEKKLENI